MQKHLDRAMAFLRDDVGAASIEYALLGGLIAVVIVAAVTAFGAKVASSFASSVATLP
ncbi:MAG: Flp family type IVb pilin [Desulfobaccales bacterium]|jgi:pilus assembly protein Flp/PilA